MSVHLNTRAPDVDAAPERRILICTIGSSTSALAVTATKPCELQLNMLGRHLRNEGMYVGEAHVSRSHCAPSALMLSCTIQAFVPFEATASFATNFEARLGEHVLLTSHIGSFVACK